MVIPIKLGESVRLVSLQFSFSSAASVPPSAKDFSLKKESYKDSNERKARASGELIMEPVPNCSLGNLVADLEEAGYILVDMDYQELVDRKDPRPGPMKRTYHMVRYLFARKESARLSDFWKGVREKIRGELQNLCNTAFWRVRAFLNPYCKNGEEIGGVFALSVNLELRVPRFHPDGRLILVWDRNEDGERVGEEQKPLAPNYCVRAENGEIVFCS